MSEAGDSDVASSKEEYFEHSVNLLHREDTVNYTIYNVITNGHVSVLQYSITPENFELSEAPEHLGLMMKMIMLFVNYEGQKWSQMV